MKKYVVEMHINLDESKLEKGQTIEDYIYNSLKEIPFNVYFVKAKEQLNTSSNGGKMQIRKL